jgi:hypothetical protein
MTIIAIPSALIFCNSCGAVSIDTPAFGWKRYRHRDIDIDIRHHCPRCADDNELARIGLVYDVDPKTTVTYEKWELAQ